MRKTFCRHCAMAVGVLLLLVFSGCADLSDVLVELWELEAPPEERPGTVESAPDEKPEPEASPIPTKPAAKTQVLCTYFHYFNAGPKTYDQWSIQGRDPRDVLGPEKWRRDIWVGRRGDYPYVGIYNNISDADMIRWHIRLAKASGIEAFLVYIFNWQTQRSQTQLMLDVAQQEEFKIAFIEHHSLLGGREIPILDGRPQPMLPHKYEGYRGILAAQSRRLGVVDGPEYRDALSQRSRDVPEKALKMAEHRISNMLKQWMSHPAYLHVDGKPMMVIPYMVEDLTAENFRRLVENITAEVGRELYIVGIVPAVYWYFAPKAVLSTGLTKEWAETGVSSFTHWTPNGMITASARTRSKVVRFHVRDSARWRKDAMIPVMPGFDDDVWRPGDRPAPTAPRNNGKAWGDQLETALAVKPRFLFIQGWNEWHEGAQIEPSTAYRNPYLYLQILAQKLKRPWYTPELPAKKSVDSLRRPYLPY
ncbi:hypothetical protein CSB45_11530 [candidate division KSB3 bacterium]|uniref:Glycoside hydrolase family 42 N-terminal domain-containing protein n=1 Tax=candidate division KSB3 bacterium TaxID=2044937 RepID=A0A2G6E326_9BACT|nr:MAG: hypothetical protein CSB45_11530 [candidate division KSB3 bacterium]PIE28943.1 MAG: hypothetical protein CSA57_11580 [candidate division KSB3 bacterium]